MLAKMLEERIFREERSEQRLSHNIIRAVKPGRTRAYGCFPFILGQ